MLKQKKSSTRYHKCLKDMSLFFEQWNSKKNQIETKMLALDLKGLILIIYDLKQY